MGFAGGGQATYSVREVAERLGVHPETVRRLIHSGRLEAAREGRVLRVAADSVHELLEHHRRKPDRT